MQLFVWNLEEHVTSDILQRLFSMYGKVRSVVLNIDPFTGKCNGSALVEMENSELAKRAIRTLHGRLLGKSHMNVRKV